MKKESYDIFISYRRLGGAERAELIKTNLEKNGYKSSRIFMDTHSLLGGDFRKKLRDAITESDNVIVIITKGCFDNIKDEDFWLFELSEAVRLQKNIVLCFFDDITSIKNANLPESLHALPYYNALKYNHEYSDAFFNKLCTFLKKKKYTKNKAVAIKLVIFFAIAIICGTLVNQNFHRSIVGNAVNEPCYDSNIVDLGLPSGTLWASSNLGASSVSEFGNLYMWGGSNPVQSVNRKDMNYCISQHNIIGTSYDAASLLLGESWSLPSEEQFLELITTCKWVWTNVDGRNGYKVIGPNSNNLFLPVAGCFLIDGFKYGNQFGYYWTGESHPKNLKYATELVIGLDQVNIESGQQYVGRSIRPVYVKNK